MAQLDVINKIADISAIDNDEEYKSHMHQDEVLRSMRKYSI